MRVVLTGPESSGKSSLTTHLAQTFNIPYADEYARIYLEKHGPDYDEALLLHICREHIRYQKQHIAPDLPLGIYDTDLTNYKIWSEFVFGTCSPDILHGIQQETDHVYLVCYPDLPWEADPLREHRYQREQLFVLHIRELDRLQRPYEIIKGRGKLRLQNAEQAFLRLTGMP